jgi:hypothetical protein
MNEVNRVLLLRKAIRKGSKTRTYLQAKFGIKNSFLQNKSRNKKYLLLVELKISKREGAQRSALVGIGSTLVEVERR